MTGQGSHQAVSATDANGSEKIRHALLVHINRSSLQAASRLTPSLSSPLSSSRSWSTVPLRTVSPTSTSPRRKEPAALTPPLGGLKRAFSC